MIFFVPAAAHNDAGRTGLRIPTAELRQITTRGFAYGFQKGFAGDGMTVVRANVLVKALTEYLAAEECLKHADNFCTLFVNGRGVKVIDALVAFRTNWMRHRTGIFLELRCTQEGYVMDALYGTRRR